MNGIYLTNKNDIKKEMLPYLMEKKIIDELGESITLKNYDEYLVSYFGFGCVNRNVIRYIYISKEYRGNGFGKRMLNDLENIIDYNHNEVILQSTLNSLEFYKKNNYQIVKSFKNVFNLKKVLK